MKAENKKQKRTGGLLKIAVCFGILFLAGCGKTDSIETIETVVVEQTEDKSVETMIDEMMNSSITEEELLTPSSELANAILEAIQVEVLEEEEEYCKIRITYPDVNSLLETALEEYSGEISEEDVETMICQMIENIEAERATVVEEEFELNITKDDAGKRQIEWTAEAIRAMSGGLYDAD